MSIVQDAQSIMCFGGALRYLVSQGLKYTGGFPWATFVAVFVLRSSLF